MGYWACCEKQDLLWPHNFCRVLDTGFMSCQGSKVLRERILRSISQIPSLESGRWESSWDHRQKTQEEEWK